MCNRIEGLMLARDIDPVAYGHRLVVLRLVPQFTSFPPTQAA